MSVRPLEKVLLWLAASFWLIMSISPFNREAWFLENILLVVGVAWVLGTYRRWRLSQVSYCLIFAFIILHVTGAHYTYSKVPLGAWLEPELNLDRNNYDRIVHFLFGLLLVYPFRDQVIRASGAGRGWASVVAFMIITSLSAVYELMEWGVTLIVQPADAAAFLGMQGDIFDAQKDCALALLGAIIALGLTALLEAMRTERWT